MKRKTFTFSCTNQMCTKLSAIIRRYADAAFPIGGSDCAQATREALLNIAGQIHDTLANTEAAISARQRVILRGAVNWYFDEVENDESTRDALLKQLKKK